MTNKNGKKGVRLHEGPVTYDIYSNLPDDGLRYEVADGVLQAMSPSPSVIHQLFSNELQFQLNQSCRNEFIILSAPLDVVLSNTEIRQPDLIMIHHSRGSIIKQQAVHGAPDVLVEILSKHSRKRDKLDKTKVYASYGVPEYWIVDLSNFTLEQYVLNSSSSIYELKDIYSNDEKIHSKQAACASFSMKQLVEALPKLPD